MNLATGRDWPVSDKLGLAFSPDSSRVLVRVVGDGGDSVLRVVDREELERR